MKHSFLLTYLDFAKKIEAKKHNYIESIISSDYEDEKDYHLLDEYCKSILRILDKAIEENSISKTGFMNDSEGTLADLLTHYKQIVKNRKIAFVIVFRNGEVWNVNFTAGLRPDRVDSHAYRFLKADANRNLLVVCSYCYQDEVSRKCINENNISQSSEIQVVDLEGLMDELLYNVYVYKETNNKVIRVSPKTELSIVNGKRGIQIEEMYSNVFKNEINLTLYKMQNDSVKQPSLPEKVDESRMEDDEANSSDSADDLEKSVREREEKARKELDRKCREIEKTEKSFFPNHFNVIVDRILKDHKEIPVEKICSINAERIGGDLEKSDINVTFKINENESTIGISVKSSSVDDVAVHQGHASDLARSLNVVEGSGVGRALINFEEKRSVEKMDVQCRETLQSFFSEDTNRRLLLERAIKGADGQNADYILFHSYTYNAQSVHKNLGIRFYSCDEYIDMLMNDESEGTFGTHLIWTYNTNSNNKEKSSIQFKIPIQKVFANNSSE